MFKTYLFLTGAIFFEVAGTMLLPISQNFTKLIPTTFLTIFCCRRSMEEWLTAIRKAMSNCLSRQVRSCDERSDQQGMIEFGEHFWCRCHLYAATFTININATITATFIHSNSLTPTLHATRFARPAGVRDHLQKYAVQGPDVHETPPRSCGQVQF